MFDEAGLLFFEQHLIRYNKIPWLNLNILSFYRVSLHFFIRLDGGTTPTLARGWNDRWSTVVILSRRERERERKRDGSPFCVRHILGGGDLQTAEGEKTRVIKVKWQLADPPHFVAAITYLSWPTRPSTGTHAPLHFWPTDSLDFHGKSPLACSHYETESFLLCRQMKYGLARRKYNDRSCNR